MKELISGFRWEEGRVKSYYKPLTLREKAEWEIAGSVSHDPPEPVRRVGDSPEPLARPAEGMAGENAPLRTGTAVSIFARALEPVAVRYRTRRCTRG